MTIAVLYLVAALTVTDSYTDSSGVLTNSGSEVAGGVLQNVDIGGSQAASFDGVDDSVTVTNFWSNLSGDDTYTFVAWVKPSTVSGNGNVWGRYGVPATGPFTFYGMIMDGGEVRLNTGAAVNLETTEIVEADKWYHIVWMKTGATTGKIYVNGVEQSTSGSVAASGSMSESLWIADYATTGNEYTGLIDELACFTNTHTAAQVADLYLGNQTPTDLGAVSWWRFNGDYTDEIGSNDGSNSGSTLTTNDLYSPRSMTVEDFELLPGLVERPFLTRSVDSVSVTVSNKPGGASAVAQFSQDQSTYYNSDGENVGNGGGYSFDGVNDEIDIGSVTATAKTVAFWVNPTDATSEVFIDGDGTDYISSDGSDQVTGTSFPAPTYYVNGVSGARVLTDGVWQHVAITDSTGADFTGMNIGKVGASYFGGLIDDVVIDDTAWTQAQIQDQMQRPPYATTLGAVSRWKLDGDATDSIGSNDGTISGATSVTDWWRLKQWGDVLTNGVNVVDLTGIASNWTNLYARLYTENPTNGWTAIDTITAEVNLWRRRIIILAGCLLPMLIYWKVKQR